MPHTRVIFTIGHSNLTAEEFLHLLRREGIDCVIDVRSQPEERYFPQFNEDRLGHFLNLHGLHYLLFCAYFGPRLYDSLDPDGRVDFERAMRSPAFLRAADRVERGMALGYRIVLMGALADPLECHRFSFLGRYFSGRGYRVCHFLRDGSLVTQRDLEQRMVADYLRHHKLSPVTTLFDAYTEAHQVADAYRLKNREIGFRT